MSNRLLEFNGIQRICLTQELHQHRGYQVLAAHPNRTSCRQAPSRFAASPILVVVGRADATVRLGARPSSRCCRCPKHQSTRPSRRRRSTIAYRLGSSEAGNQKAAASWRLRTSLRTHALQRATLHYQPEQLAAISLISSKRSMRTSAQQNAICVQGDKVPADAGADCHSIGSGGAQRLARLRVEIASMNTHHKSQIMHSFELIPARGPL